MNDYITLDSNKYRTTHRTWRPARLVPNTDRLLLSGSLDVTFGNGTILEWAGEIVGPVTADGAGWGTITNLRTSLEKRQLLSFTDHYGTTKNVVVKGLLSERSLSPKLDGTDNVIYVTVILRATA